MSETQVKLRLSNELSAEIEKLIGHSEFGDSKNAVIVELISRGLHKENPEAEIDLDMTPESDEGSEINFLLSEIKKLLQTEDKRDGTDTQKLVRTIAGETGSLRAEIIKKLDAVRSSIDGDAESRFRSLESLVLMTGSRTKYALVLASICFVMVSLFSALKIYTIEEARRPLSEEVSKLRDFKKGVEALACQSRSGHVEFSPVFLAELCGLRVR